MHDLGDFEEVLAATSAFQYSRDDSDKGFTPRRGLAEANFLFRILYYVLSIDGHLILVQHLASPSLPVRIDNVHKLWLQRCASNKESINVRLRRCSNPYELSHELQNENTRTKFLGIPRGDRATVYDPRCLGNALRDVRLQELTNVGVSVLRLCCSSNPARANRPHWLIRNYNIATKVNFRFGFCWKRWRGVLPVSRILEGVHDSLKLRVNHLCRLFSFSFCEGFPDTEDDFERGV